MQLVMSVLGNYVSQPESGFGVVQAIGMVLPVW